MKTITLTLTEEEFTALYVCVYHWGQEVKDLEEQRLDINTNLMKSGKDPITYEKNLADSQKIKSLLKKLDVVGEEIFGKDKEEK